MKVENSDFTLDSLDRDIIALLGQDGRMAFTEIAKRLSIPEATVRYRVQRLLQSEIIQIHARLNPQKLGTPHIVTLRFNVERDQINAVASELVSMSEVQFVAIVTGQYNLLIDACFHTHEELLALFETIHQIPGIIHYDSAIALKLLKSEYQYTVA